MEFIAAVTSINNLVTLNYLFLLPCISDQTLHQLCAVTNSFPSPLKDVSMGISSSSLCPFKYFQWYFFQPEIQSPRNSPFFLHIITFHPQQGMLRLKSSHWLLILPGVRKPPLSHLITSFFPHENKPITHNLASNTLSTSLWAAL